MKSILISIRPEFVAKILNGQKTLEIRRTAPKCDLPIDVYIYCTEPRAKEVVSLFVDEVRPILGRTCEFINREAVDKDGMRWSICNGRVAAKFRLRKVDNVLVLPFGELTEWEEELLAKSCLSLTELDRYLKEDYGYAWHIDDLQIFDKPMELSDFEYEKKYHGCAKCPHNVDSFPPDDFSVCARGCEELLPVRRAPQSWMYISADVPNNPHKIVH